MKMEYYIPAIRRIISNQTVMNYEVVNLVKLYNFI